MRRILPLTLALLSIQLHPQPAGAKLTESLDYSGNPKVSATIGKPAPDFRLQDLDGKEFKLSDLRGKTLLLDFWATWCAPCRAEMPTIESIHKEYPDVVVLGIDVGEDREVVRKFTAENRVTYPILLAGHDRIADDYNAHSFPSVVIVDPGGIVRAHIVGYGSSTDRQLRTALFHPTPQSDAPPPAVFRVGGGVTAPSVTYKIDPEYSEAARKARLPAPSCCLSLSVPMASLATSKSFGRSASVSMKRLSKQSVNGNSIQAARVASPSPPRPPSKSTSASSTTPPPQASLSR